MNGDINSEIYPEQSVAYRTHKSKDLFDVASFETMKEK